MEPNSDTIQILVQAGLVGIFVAIIIFGFRWYDRKQGTSDKRIDSDKEIMLALIESTKQNSTQTALTNKTLSELHQFMVKLNGKLENAVASKAKKGKK